MTTTPTVPAAPSAPAAPNPSAPARSGVGTFWRVAGIVTILATFLWGGVNILSLLAHTSRTADDAIPAAGLDAIRVRLDNGEARLVGTTASTVAVHARIDEGFIAADYRVEVVGDRLEIVGGCSWVADWRCSIDVTVEVPRGLDVEVRTDNGTVSAEDLDGSLQFESSNGDLRLANLAGVVTAETDNGSVVGRGLDADTVVATSDNGDLDLELTRPPRGAVATSSNGDVDVRLPRDETAYALDATSDNGSLDTQIRTDPGSDRSIRLHSDNGDVSIRYANR